MFFLPASVVMPSLLFSALKVSIPSTVTSQRASFNADDDAVDGKTKELKNHYRNALLNAY